MEKVEKVSTWEDLGIVADLGDREREGEGKSPPVIEQSRHCDEHHEKEKRLVDAADDNCFTFLMKIIFSFFLFLQNLMMINYILLLLPLIL